MNLITVAVMLGLVSFIQGGPVEKKLQEDKEHLQLLLREINDDVQELEKDLKDLDEKEVEPVIEAETSEMDVEERGRGNNEKSDKRGKWNNPRLPGLDYAKSDKRGRWKNPRLPGLDVDKDVDSDTRDNNVETTRNTDLRKAMKLLLDLIKLNSAQDNQD